MDFYRIEYLLKNFEESLEEEDKQYKKQQKEYEKQYKVDTHNPVSNQSYGGFKIPKMEIPNVKIPTKF